MVLAEPEHIRRLKGVVSALQQMIEQNNDGSGMARMAFFMTTFTDELAEELGELDEIQVRLYLYQIGEVISWIGHGDNERLPDAVKEFGDMINPTREEVIPDGNVDENPGTYLQLDSSAGGEGVDSRSVT